VQVPSVVGEDKSVATGTLQDKGFNVTVRSVASNQPKDRVISQNPSAGSTVDKGTRVTLLVSKGPQKVTVPSVVGQAEADARATLKGVGFKVVAVKQESKTATPGNVVRQSPPGDSKATKGSVVTIYVAKAPKKPNNGGTPTTRRRRRAGPSPAAAPR
jgi:serine/threonine-protein kinase